MKKLGITQGEVIVSEIELKDWSTCCVAVNKGMAICHLYYEGFEITKEVHNNAELIADAFNTANKCDMLPSELLEQRDEAKELVRLFIKEFEHENATEYECELFFKAKNLLSNV